MPIAEVTITLPPTPSKCEKETLDLEDAGVISLELGNLVNICPCCGTGCCKLFFTPQGFGSDRWRDLSWSYDCESGDWSIESIALQDGAPYRSRLVSSCGSNAEITSEPADGDYDEGAIITVAGTSTPPTCPHCRQPPCPEPGYWQIDLGGVFQGSWRGQFNAFKCDEFGLPVPPTEELCRFTCSDFCLWVCACGQNFEHPEGIGIGECFTFSLRRPTCRFCDDGTDADGVNITICRISDLNFEVTVEVYCVGEIPPRTSDTKIMVVNLASEFPECDDAIINGVFIQLGNSGDACDCRGGIPAPCCPPEYLLPYNFFMTLVDFFVEGLSVPDFWTPRLNRLILEYVGEIDDNTQRWQYRGFHHWSHPTITALENDTDWEWVITIDCDDRFPTTNIVTINAYQNNSPNVIIQGVGSGDNPCNEPASMRWTILNPGDYMDWLLEYE